MKDRKKMLYKKVCFWLRLKQHCLPGIIYGSLVITWSPELKGGADGWWCWPLTACKSLVCDPLGTVFSVIRVHGTHIENHIKKQTAIRWMQCTFYGFRLKMYSMSERTYVMNVNNKFISIFPPLWSLCLFQVSHFASHCFCLSRYTFTVSYFPHFMQHSIMSH